MNSRTAIFTSVMVNIALGGIVGYLAWRAHGNSSPGPEQERTRLVTNTLTIPRKVISGAPFLFGGRPLTWGAIESTNYVEYIQNLRLVGCPEETIRDIIITDVAKYYGRKRAELRDQAGPYLYWRSDDPLDTTADPELEAKLRALSMEQRVLIRELLDVDLPAEMAKYTEGEEYSRRAFAFLPEEKRMQLKGVESDYDEREQEIYRRSKGILVGQDLEDLRNLQQEREAVLAQLLTPGELEQYEMRKSPSATNLRNSLSGFDVSEEEFQKLFRLQKTYDQEFASFDFTDDKQIEAHAQAQEQAQAALDEQIKSVLGNERFAEYQRGQDSDYKTALSVSERFAIPRESAAKVYDIKADTESKMQRIENNPALSPEQKQAALVALAVQAERSAAAAMGGPESAAWKAYDKAGPGWLAVLRNVAQQALASTLEPQPEPARTPPYPPMPPLPPFPFPQPAPLNR